MKKLLMITGALIALTASTAFAAGQLHLSVADCGATGTPSVTNTCTNTGAIILVGSVISPQALPHFVAMEGIVDIAQANATLSPWWQAQSGGCRDGRITGNFDFTGGPFSCFDFFSGLATGSLFFIYPGTGSTLSPAGSARIDIYCSLAENQAAPIDNTTEYYMFKITISKLGTVGGCAGCADPTSLFFNDLLLGQPPADQLNLDLSGDGQGQGCSYNGGNTPTPAKNTSWGSIKALYR